MSHASILLSKFIYMLSELFVWCQSYKWKKRSIRHHAIIYWNLLHVLWISNISFSYCNLAQRYLVLNFISCNLSNVKYVSVDVMYDFKVSLYMQVILSDYIGKKYVIPFFCLLDFTFVFPTGELLKWKISHADIMLIFLEINAFSDCLAGW